jgi:transposase-like protein
VGKIFAMTQAGQAEPVHPLVVAPMARQTRQRRSWTLDEKLAIIAEVESSGDPVAVVARRHDMNANHLFNWIDLARAGALGRRSRKERVGEEESSRKDDREAESGPRTSSIWASSRAKKWRMRWTASASSKVDLPDRLRMRVPISVEPELLTRAVRALKAA